MPRSRRFRNRRGVPNIFCTPFSLLTPACARRGQSTYDLDSIRYDGYSLVDVDVVAEVVSDAVDFEKALSA